MDQADGKGVGFDPSMQGTGKTNELTGNLFTHAVEYSYKLTKITSNASENT